MPLDDLAYSRPDATAALLASASSEAGRISDKSVFLTGEADCLATINGSLCFLDSLRLLVRICRYVYVWIPPSEQELFRAAAALAKSIQFNSAVRFLESQPDPSTFDSVLLIGSTPLPNARCTTINSEGWIARVTSSNEELANCYTRPNPVTALFAACLGVSEIFKRLLGVYPSRAAMIEGLSFNLFDRTVEDADTGPPLPDSLDVTGTWILGLGAIGNGVILLLSKLGLRGDVLLVDPQAYGKENLGTCIAIGPSDVGLKKAEVMAGFLRAKSALTASAIVSDLGAIRARVGNDLGRPKVVLAGFDNIEARQEAQALWPDLLIDGAIGDFGVQTATHQWGSKLVCMQCLFKIPAKDALQEASEITGLSRERAANAEALITHEDVDVASVDKKEFLRARVGKRVCSVISEASVRKISAARDFSPSVPFVACASSCIMVTSLIRHFMNSGGHHPNRYYFDMLIGPSSGDDIAESADPQCICQMRRVSIQAWRDST